MARWRTTDRSDLARGLADRTGPAIADVARDHRQCRLVRVDLLVDIEAIERGAGGRLQPFEHLLLADVQPGRGRGRKARAARCGLHLMSAQPVGADHHGGGVSNARELRTHGGQPALLDLKLIRLACSDHEIRAWPEAG